MSVYRVICETEFRMLHPARTRHGQRSTAPWLPPHRDRWRAVLGWRALLQHASGPSGAGGRSVVGAVISSQKLRKRCTRFSGALPAMIAALIAPIEIPATQSGKLATSALARRCQIGKVAGAHVDRADTQ
jgi:hypothetical protein